MNSVGTLFPFENLKDVVILRADLKNSKFSLREIIFPGRRKNFYDNTIFEDLNPVFGVPGDRPAITCFRNKAFIIDHELHPA